jgi:hypothetical protein
MMSSSIPKSAFLLISLLNVARGFSPALSIQPSLIASAATKNGPETTTCLHSQASSLQDESQNGRMLMGRRELLTVSATSAAVAAGWQWQQQTPTVTTATASEEKNSFQNLASIEDVLRVIDSQCDRRFLHAVVASGYQCLYRSVLRQQGNMPLVVLSAAAASDNEKVPRASDFLESLVQTQTAKDQTGSPLLPSTGPFHLTVTNPKSSILTKPQQQEDQIPMSVWPLGDNVHFAWTEQERELLWSRSNNAFLVNASSKLIVDGIDCGVMSLEDALERSNGQVMVHADSYLMVPTFMEQELISKLKNSFII